MSKKEILKVINDAIKEEKGQPVTIESNMADANLDSLGMLMVLVIIDSKYHMLEKDEKDADAGEEIKAFAEMSVKEVVVRCVLAGETH